MKDFFNGKKDRRMKLTAELLEKGIVDIYIENKPRQIKIIYDREGQAQKPLVIPVLEFVYPTVDQLDGLVTLLQLLSIGRFNDRFVTKAS